MDNPKTAIGSWRTDSTILNITIALGIIAIFLAGAGFIAYVASNKNRFRQQTMTAVPATTQTITSPTPQPLMKHRSTQPKMKTVPQEDIEKTENPT